MKANKSKLNLIVVLILALSLNLVFFTLAKKIIKSSLSEVINVKHCDYSHDSKDNIGNQSSKNALIK